MFLRLLKGSKVVPSLGLPYRILNLNHKKGATMGSMGIYHITFLHLLVYIVFLSGWIRLGYCLYCISTGGSSLGIKALFRALLHRLLYLTPLRGSGPGVSSLNVGA